MTVSFYTHVHEVNMIILHITYQLVKFPPPVPLLSCTKILFPLRTFLTNSSERITGITKGKKKKKSLVFSCNKIFKCN